MAKHASQPRLTPNSFGYFEIRWTDNGRSNRVSTGTKNSEEAQSFFAGWLQERLIPSTTTNSWTVNQLLDLYWKEKAHKKLSAGRTEAIIRILKNAFAKLTPAMLTADRISAYIEQRAVGQHGGRPAMQSTVRRELKILVAALNHAVRQRRVSAGSFPHIELPPDGEPRHTIIPDQHIDLMLERAGQKLHRFIALATETASRKRAIETLTWAQVDFEHRIIHFKDDTVRTVKKRVSVPMSDDLHRRMGGWRGDSAEGSPVIGTSAPISHAWTALMHKLAKETGDMAFLDYVPHDLRRTWATRAARAGVDLWQIAGVLGDSLAVVTKHYAHHCPKHLRAAVNFRAVEKEVIAPPCGSGASRESVA